MATVSQALAIAIFQWSGLSENEYQTTDKLTVLWSRRRINLSPSFTFQIHGVPQLLAAIMSQQEFNECGQATNLTVTSFGQNGIETPQQLFQHLQHC